MKRGLVVLAFCSPAAALCMPTYTTVPPPAPGPAISRVAAANVLCQAAVPAVTNRQAVVKGCTKQLIEHPETLDERSWIFITRNTGHAKLSAEAFKAYFTLHDLPWTIFLINNEE